jgi:hypothetical protein
MDNKNKILKVLAVILLIAFVIPVFTGCGFSASYTKDSTDYSESGANSIKNSNNQHDQTKNSLVVEWEDTISSLNSSGNPVRDKNGIWAMSIHSYNNYGMNGRNGGISLFRELAITMYESVFNTTYSRTDDYFVKSDGSLGRLQLTPISLVKKVNQITSEYFADDYATKNGLTTVVDYIQGMACAILMAIWSMGFISQVVNEKFTMETLLKTLMQLMCGIVLITNSDVLVVAFANIGTDLINGFTDDTTAFTAFQTQMYNMLRDNIFTINIGFDLGLFIFGIGTIWIDLGCIFVMLHLVVPLIALIVCAYKIVSIMIMRMLELIIRITLAPIPLAFGAQQGFSQDSIRYLRGIAACALQPVLIIIGALCIGTIANCILAIFGGSQQSHEITGFTAVLAFTLSYLVFAAFLGEVKRLAQEIVAR